MKDLYANVTGVDKVLSASVTTSHGSSVSVAIIDGIGVTADIGNSIQVDLGYVDNHQVIFTGYVKNVDRKVAPDTITITAQDVLSRAVDYFVVSSTPDTTFKRSNILAEDLVEDVLALAGLTNYNFTPTSFTFAVTADVYAEVSLVSAYDYCKGISDILAWHLYADTNGTVHFINRKPYVMTGTSGQPGDVADSILKTVTDATTITIIERLSDRDLRNRIVVWGHNLTAEASVASPFLPDGFYRSVALIWPILDSQTTADTAAEYNLALLNRLNRQVSISVEGDPDLVARKVITLQNSRLGINENYYIYSAEHNWSRTGYLTNMELRR